MDADANPGARLVQQLCEGKPVCIIKGGLTGASGVIVGYDAGQCLVKLDTLEGIYVAIQAAFLEASPPKSLT